MWPTWEILREPDCTPPSVQVQRALVTLAPGRDKICRRRHAPARSLKEFIDGKSIYRLIFRPCERRRKRAGTLSSFANAI